MAYSSRYELSKMLLDYGTLASQAINTYSSFETAKVKEEEQKYIKAQRTKNLLLEEEQKIANKTYTSSFTTAIDANMDALINFNNNQGDAIVAYSQIKGLLSNPKISQAIMTDEVANAKYKVFNAMVNSPITMSIRGNDNNDITLAQMGANWGNPNYDPAIQAQAYNKASLNGKTMLNALNGFSSGMGQYMTITSDQGKTILDEFATGRSIAENMAMFDARVRGKANVEQKMAEYKYMAQEIGVPVEDVIAASGGKTQTSQVIKENKKLLTDTVGTKSWTPAKYDNKNAQLISDREVASYIQEANMANNWYTEANEATKSLTLITGEQYLSDNDVSDITKNVGYQDSSILPKFNGPSIEEYEKLPDNEKRLWNIESKKMQYKEKLNTISTVKSSALGSLYSAADQIGITYDPREPSAIFRQLSSLAVDSKLTERDVSSLESVLSKVKAAARRAEDIRPDLANETAATESISRLNSTASALETILNRAWTPEQKARFAELDLAGITSTDELDPIYNAGTTLDYGVSSDRRTAYEMASGTGRVKEEEDIKLYKGKYAEYLDYNAQQTMKDSKMPEEMTGLDPYIQDLFNIGF